MHIQQVKSLFFYSLYYCACVNVYFVIVLVQVLSCDNNEMNLIHHDRLKVCMRPELLIGGISVVDLYLGPWTLP